MSRGRSFHRTRTVAVLIGGMLPGMAMPSASQPELAYAQWLLDSGDAFGAAVVLQQMPPAYADPSALERRQRLQARTRTAIDTLLRMPAPSAAEGSAHASLETVEAHLADGHPERAVTVLEGLMAREDEEAMDLRDACHLLLARIALRAGRVETAREHYQSISSPGPLSSEALLELGWSYLLPVRVDAEADAPSRKLLAPSALPLRASSPEVLAQLRRETPFRSYAGVARSERAADLATSVRIWQELIGRDPLDLAVQEGQLALAYALEHMGDHQRALHHYERTVSVLARGRELLGTAMAHVRSKQLVTAIARGSASPVVHWPWWTVERRASRWWIGDDRSPLALFYARYLIADHAFAAAAERLQLIYAVRAHLRGAVATARDGAAEAAGILERLAPVVREAETAIEAHAIDLLQERQTRIESLLAEAHFAIARMHEPDAFARDATVLTGEGAS
ncbi:tetratricopeptide repeat protein [Algiphilus sp.]|uniref:tetratricopeptide repeat protein n=1 Tax=Algiphilus sp. TaxID=1872431 RepID=UPI003B528CE8